MGIRLRQSGIDDFVVLEKGSGVGGTWYHNRYPGCECDIPSHLYSFSFELNPEWNHVFSRQPDIRAYLEHCTDRYGLRAEGEQTTVQLDQVEISGTSAARRASR